LVKNRNDFFRRAKEAGIELGDWFLSPIHPITKNFECWLYHWGENPIADSISKCIVNLPTHIDITFNNINEIEDFLKRNK
ncbi:unnamed protein product, partial [marine sediment metagenome]